MIIAVTGGRECIPQVRELAKALGYEIMKHGHDLLNGGAEGVDTAAVEGAKVYERQKPGGRIIVYRPESNEQPHAQGYTEVSIKGANHAERRDAVARDADVLIILDGGKYTKEICQRALNYGTPILPLGSTGGAALEQWHEIKADTAGHYAYRSVLTEDDFRLMNSRELNAVEATAEQVVRLAERVTGPQKTSNALIHKPPVPNRFRRRYLDIQRSECTERFDTLTEHIAALNTSIGRELDRERKLVLEERLAELKADREQVVAEIERIERQLAGSSEVGLAHDPRA